MSKLLWTKSAPRRFCQMTQNGELWDTKISYIYCPISGCSWINNKISQRVKGGVTRKASFSKNLALLEKAEIPEPRPKPRQNSPSCRSRPESSRASQAWLTPWVRPPPSTPAPPKTPRPCSCRRHAWAGSGSSKTPATPQVRRRGPRLHGLRGPRRPATQAAAPGATPAAEGTPRLEPCRKRTRPLTIQAPWTQDPDTGTKQLSVTPERSGDSDQPKALSKGGSRLERPPLSSSSTKLRPSLRSAPKTRHLLGTPGLLFLIENERTQGSPD